MVQSVITLQNFSCSTKRLVRIVVLQDVRICDSTTNNYSSKIFLFYKRLVCKVVVQEVLICDGTTSKNFLVLQKDLHI